LGGRPAGPAFRPGWGLVAARQGPSLAAAAAKAAGRPLNKQISAFYFS